MFLIAKEALVLWKRLYTKVLTPIPTSMTHTLICEEGKDTVIPQRWFCNSWCLESVSFKTDNQHA